jgi:hypothetical protein
MLLLGDVDCDFVVVLVEFFSLGSCYPLYGCIGKLHRVCFLREASDKITPLLAEVSVAHLPEVQGAWIESRPGLAVVGREDFLIDLSIHEEQSNGLEHQS